MKRELGTGRVAFLVKPRFEAIKREVESGRTTMSVWREFGAEVGIKYSQFDRYVKRFIKGDTKRKEETKPEIKKRPQSGLPQFKENTNNDDLIYPKSK